MSSDRRRQQIESLVEAVLERPTKERAAYLEDACAGNPEMQREAESLMAYYNGVDSFLERPLFPGLAGQGVPWDTTLTTSSRTEPFSEQEIHDRRFGRYRILEHLGEGGMGTVYLAEQTEPIRRQVALKVIRAGLLRKQVIQRFQGERQAMARMNHPFIAQAYDAGETQEGQPYFVMEYVPGRPITSYADARRMTVEERLELFMAVCEGVQHLHQKGVIHRDIKPSNILVVDNDGRPCPKIIDFGIAKGLDNPLTEGTLLTDIGMIGTPSYLSPEAVRGSGTRADVDTRSDVYALGVLLYELLTGELPLDTSGSNLLEIARRIVEDETSLASRRLSALDPDVRQTRGDQRRLDPKTLERRLRGDLDHIAQKAMAKEAEQRYASAAELAADVRRHLRHEPVSAQAPSGAYQLGKFVRRNRSAVATVFLFAMMLIIGLVARTFEASRANREAARANREAARANQEAARANQEAEAAGQVSNFLVTLFEESDPDKARSGELTARQILERGAAKLESQELEHQPLARAQLMDTIGTVYRKLGFDDDAIAMLERALEVREAHLGAEHLDVATSCGNLGNAHWYRGDYQQALDFHLRSLAIREKHLGPIHYDIAKALNNVGSMHTLLGNFDEAEDVLGRSLAMRREVLEAGHPGLATGLNGLGMLLSSQQRFAEAKPLLDEALDILTQEFGADHPRVAPVLNNLAYIAFELEDYDESEKLHARALKLKQANLGEHHAEIARGLANLAEVYWKQGRFAEAERDFQRATEIWRQVGGDDNPELAQALLGLANVFRDEGRLAEARPLYQQAIEIREAAFADDHPDLVQTLEEYRTFLELSGHDQQAQMIAQRLIERSN